MIDTEILQDYSTEARELLEEMDNSLIRLEKEGGSPELLNNIFRAVHCIKGSAEYIGLERSSTLTHGVENLLDKLREGALQVTPGVIDFLFRVKDLVGSLIDEVTKEREEKTDISGVMRELETFSTKGGRLEALGEEEEVAAPDELGDEESLAGMDVPTAELEAQVDEELGVSGEEPTDVFDTEAEPGEFETEYPSALTEDLDRAAEEGIEAEPGVHFTEELAATIDRATAETTEDVEPESFEARTEEVEEFGSQVIPSKGTLEETVPQVLNISLYLDDLEDGLRPRDIVPSLLDTIDNLTRALEDMEMPDALTLLREMESRVDSIDTMEDSPPLDRVSELRTLLRDLQACYPPDAFPHEEPTVTKTELVEPPELSEEKAAFFRELERIPGMDRSLMEAVYEAGFTSMAQVVGSDMETLTAIAEMPFSVAETMLGKVVDIPEEAKRQAPATQAADRSLLADIDDELLGEFQSVFGPGKPAAAEVAIHKAVESVPGGVASDLLGEVESLGEETDREIVEIFVSYGWEILDKMSPLLQEIDKGEAGRDAMESCANLIKQIRSSSTYMDYQQLASFLDDWYEKTLWGADRIELLGPDTLTFMKDNFVKLQDFLRGLEVVLKPEAVTPAPAAEPVVPPAPEPAAAEPPRPEIPVQPAAAQTRPAPEPAERATPEPAVPIAAEAAPPPPHPAEEERPPEALQYEEALLSRDVSREAPVVRTMRVDAAKVDMLLNQVGELVVNRSYVEQLSLQLKSFQRELLSVTQISKREIQAIKDIALKVAEASLSLGRTANDLQEGVMKLRMLPVGQLFNRMPRLIRDLSRRIGKKVGLQVQGGDTEVDKRVIEQVYNPLVHLIRNAVDHGIEESEVRTSAGKKEEGTIRLSAYSEGNQVVIDVEDDGRGINTEAVVAKAVENRLVDAGDAKALTTQEIYNFLFVPGFSTSKQVSRTSGRGVGMDVVKKDVEKINGHVEIESWKDTGTRISIKIPLTLAIIQTLLIRFARHVFAIPLTSVREIIQVSRSEITTIEGFEVIKFRDETIPILRIEDVFNLNNQKPSEEPRYLVLATVGLKTVGFPVEELVGESDVVIKPLAEHVFKSRGLAGSTILGDGTIALVMDVGELIEDVVARQKQLRSPGWGVPATGETTNELEKSLSGSVRK